MPCVCQASAPPLSPSICDFLSSACSQFGSLGTLQPSPLLAPLSPLTLQTIPSQKLGLPTSQNVLALFPVPLACLSSLRTIWSSSGNNELFKVPLPPLPCPPPEDSFHPPPGQESSSNQHFVLVNMHGVKSLSGHFPVHVSGPQHLHSMAVTTRRNFVPIKQLSTTTQASNHYSLCLCEFGKLTHISGLMIFILLRLVCT